MSASVLLWLALLMIWAWFVVVLLRPEHGYLHALAHRCGFNGSTTALWRRRDGITMVGHRCLKCGKLTRIRPIGSYLYAREVPKD